MKNIIALLAGVLLLGACAAPKYTYHFDYYDYNSGRKTALNANSYAHATAEAPAHDKALLAEKSPLLIEKTETMTSSASHTLAPVEAPGILKHVSGKKYVDMTKSEKKAFRKELKTEIKKYVKDKKEGASISETKAMDYNLKMAIIFSAVALTLSFFGGVNSVFWILSVVSLVVAVVFFIKWIAEQ